MAPALTCVLLAQLAAATVLRPVPPLVAPALGKGVAPPVHIIHLPTIHVAPGAVAREGVKCPVRMRTADPALDPGIVGGTADPSQATALDPHFAVDAKCAVNVDAEAYKRK